MRFTPMNPQPTLYQPSTNPQPTPYEPKPAEGEFQTFFPVFPLQSNEPPQTAVIERDELREAFKQGEAVTDKHEFIALSY